LLCIDKKMYKIAITVEDSGHGVELRADKEDRDQGDGGNDKDNFDDIDDLDEEDNPGEERRLTEIDNQVHKTQGGNKLGLEGNMFNTCMRYVVSHNKV
jgi:hypothetical protein